MTNLPTLSRLNQEKRLETFVVEHAFAHLRFDGVPRDREGGLAARQHGDLRTAVGEFEVLKRFELRTEMTIAIVGPAIVDAGTLVNRDIGMIEGRNPVEILREK